MSYLDLLPVDLYTYIFELKHELETKDLHAFADDFDMHIIKCKRK